jgi:hypothetical protein
MEASRYLPTVAWRTIITNVIYLTEATISSPATYRVSVNPLDFNEIFGVDPSDVLKIGYYIKDYIGHTYSIIAVNGMIIDISDDFRVGFGPQSGRYGLVYKSV